MNGRAVAGRASAKMFATLLIGFLAFGSTACGVVHSPAAVATAEALVVVGVRDDGQIHWNGEAVSIEELERRADRTVGSETEFQLLLDRNPPPASVGRVIEILKSTGRLKKAYVVKQATQ